MQDISKIPDCEFIEIKTTQKISKNKSYENLKDERNKTINETFDKMFDDTFNKTSQTLESFNESIETFKRMNQQLFSMDYQENIFCDYDLSNQNKLKYVKPIAINEKIFESLNSKSYSSSESQSRNSEIDIILKSPVQKNVFEIPRSKNPSISQSSSYQRNESFFDYNF